MRGRFRYRGHRPDEAAIRAVFASADSPIGRDLDRRAQRVEALAKQLVGVKSGRLRGSIRRQSGANQYGAYVHVVAGIPGVTDYLQWHHFGAAPHVIRPRRARALRFEINGRIVFATKVNHPGNRAVPFLTRALDAA